MAVTFTPLTTSGTTTDGVGPFTTASITPAANQPVLLVVTATVTTSPTPTITPTGCNLTWSTVVNTTTANTRTIWLFLGIGASPTSGTVTLTGDGTTTLTSMVWSATQCAGVNTTTNHGVVQSTSALPAAATTVSVNFPNPVSSSNGTFAGIMIQAADSTLAAGSGWTSAGMQTETVPSGAQLAEYASTAQQAITANWTTSTGSKVVGAELATATANVPPTANAGPDQTGIEPWTTVTLDGSGSSDSDGTVASYAWTQTAGSPVTLSSSSAQKPTFTAPGTLSGTTLTFSLTVTDNLGATSTADTVNITVLQAAERIFLAGSWAPAHVSLI